MDKRRINSKNIKTRKVGTSCDMIALTVNLQNKRQGRVNYEADFIGRYLFCFTLFVNIHLILGHFCQIFMSRLGSIGLFTKIKQNYTAI